MKLTISQASRAVGKSRSLIHKLVSNGKISAARGEDGRVRIEASELLRVYPSADLERRDSMSAATPPEGHEAPAVGAPRSSELESLRAERDRLLLELERERRARDQDQAKAIERENWLKGQVEATQRLLTDQRDPDKSAQTLWSKFWT